MCTKLYFMIVLSVFFSVVASSQQISCTPEDAKAFEDKMAELGGLPKQHTGHTVVAVGKTFLGIPYVAKTLEIGETESLVINLQGLDCTTFVENVLAFSWMLQNGKTHLTDFTSALEKIRYRDGQLDGYASRLHYFTEWVDNNEAKGILNDITAEVGGKPIAKDIDFMSSHRELYPFLKDDTTFEKIKATEEYLKDRTTCFLPQDSVQENEHLIRSGDIIALTTAIKGLDVTHTGIATRENDGRIYLLHASTIGEVVVSQSPLSEYLKKVKNNTGILVARPSY